MLNYVFWWHIMPEIEFKSRCDMGSERAMPVVSLKSGSPIFDTQKTKKKRARRIYNFATPYGQAK